MIPSTLDLLREELAHKRTIKCETITLSCSLVEQLLSEAVTRSAPPVETIGGGWFAPPPRPRGDDRWGEAWSRWDAEEADEAAADFTARRIARQLGESRAGFTGALP